jgi:hypothetical protein
MSAKLPRVGSIENGTRLNDPCIPSAFMGRICHYVLMFEGQWSVRFDHVFHAEKFVTLNDAIVSAREHAAGRWERLGLPSGVIFESPDGTDIQDEIFG